MKRIISKKTLLIVAASLFISTIPIHAVDENVQQAVEKQKSFFSGWGIKSLQEKLNSSMNALDKMWKRFKTCVKKEEGCPPGLANAIRGSLISILALIGIIAFYKYGPESARRKMQTARTKIGEGLSTGKTWAEPYTSSVTETVTPYLKPLQERTGRMKTWLQRKRALVIPTFGTPAYDKFIKQQQEKQ